MAWHRICNRPEGSPAGNWTSSNIQWRSCHTCLLTSVPRPQPLGSCCITRPQWHTLGIWTFCMSHNNHNDETTTSYWLSHISVLWIVELDRKCGVYQKNKSGHDSKLLLFICILSHTLHHVKRKKYQCHQYKTLSVENLYRIIQIITLYFFIMWVIQNAQFSR